MSYLQNKNMSHFLQSIVSSSSSWKWIHPFILWLFPVWVVCHQWVKQNPFLFSSFNWYLQTDISKKWPCQVMLAHCLSAEWPARPEHRTRSVKLSWSHGPELCSMTLACLCDLWISISSNGASGENMKSWKTCYFWEFLRN